MAQYTAGILWQRGEQDFLGNRYSRRHLLRFDGGAEVAASLSPHVVPVPMSDAAVGVMAKNSEGKMAMTRVTLRPEVHFSGEKLPTREQIDQLHHEAHEECFIANSVRTEVRCEPVYLPA